MQANTRKVWGSNKPALADIDWESGDDRTLCHNTYRITVDGEPAVRFHATVIIRRKSEGAYVLDSGGYRTSTTKQRLNALMPPGIGHVYQQNFDWFVTAKKGVQDIPFTDGMTVTTY